MSNLILGCPCCTKVLTAGKEERYESLLEHVSNPNGIPSLKIGYYCSNESCIANKEKFNWIDSGEIFTNSTKWNSPYIFIDGNDGPFHTIQRRLNVEISKKDENFTLLNIYWWKWQVEFKYEADDLGNILKRTFKINTLKKDGNFYIYWTSGFAMFNYCMDKFHKNIKYALEGPSEFNIKHVLKDFEPLPEWDKRLYRRFFKFWINTFYSKYKDGMYFIIKNETFSELAHKKSQMD